MGRFSRAARAAIAPAARARKLRLETLMDLHLGSELTFAFWAKGFYASVSPASIAFPAGHVEQLDDRKARRALRLGYNAANREPREKMIFSRRISKNKRSALRKWNSWAGLIAKAGLPKAMRVPT